MSTVTRDAERPPVFASPQHSEEAAIDSFIFYRCPWCIFYMHPELTGDLDHTCALDCEPYVIQESEAHISNTAPETRDFIVTQVYEEKAPRYQPRILPYPIRLGETEGVPLVFEDGKNALTVSDKDEVGEPIALLVPDNDPRKEEVRDFYSDIRFVDEIDILNFEGSDAATLMMEIAETAGETVDLIVFAEDGNKLTPVVVARCSLMTPDAAERWESRTQCNKSRTFTSKYINGNDNTIAGIRAKIEGALVYRPTLPIEIAVANHKVRMIKSLHKLYVGLFPRKSDEIFNVKSRDTFPKGAESLHAEFLAYTEKVPGKDAFGRVMDARSLYEHWMELQSIDDVVRHYRRLYFWLKNAIYVHSRVKETGCHMCKYEGCEHKGDEYVRDPVYINVSGTQEGIEAMELLVPSEFIWRGEMDLSRAFNRYALTNRKKGTYVRAHPGVKYLAGLTTAHVKMPEGVIENVHKRWNDNHPGLKYVAMIVSERATEIASVASILASRYIGKLKSSKYFATFHVHGSKNRVVYDKEEKKFKEYEGDYILNSVVTDVGIEPGEDMAEINISLVKGVPVWELLVGRSYVFYRLPGNFAKWKSISIKGMNVEQTLGKFIEIVDGRTIAKVNGIVQLKGKVSYGDRYQVKTCKKCGNTVIHTNKCVCGSTEYTTHSGSWPLTQTQLKFAVKGVGVKRM